MPIYNVEKYIHECINSILNQTFTDFELILIDDGSLDSCPNICDEYAKCDSRVRVIHQENRGVAYSRNLGIELAEGEFITFVDSDDYIDNRMYEVMINCSTEYKSEMVMCDYTYIYERDKGMDINKPKLDNIKVENLNNIRCLQGLYGYDPIAFEVLWNKIYKKDLFDNLKFEEDRIHEDSIIIHELLYKCNKTTYIHEQLYFYRKRENSITYNAARTTSLDKIYALKKRMDFFMDKGLIDLKYRAEYDYRSKFMVSYYKAKEDLPNVEITLKEFKLEFNKGFINLLKNPYYKLKEKLVVYLFMINPYLYNNYIKFKNYKWKLENY